MKTLSLYTKFTKAIVSAISAIAIVTIASTSFAGTMKKDIVDTAVAAGSFNTLATALTEAGLIETLKGDGPFTVFAPTDEAFAKLPEEQLAAILADKELLTSILTYHVVAGKVMAEQVTGMDSAPTVQGQSVKISADSGVMIDGANVVQADIEASNGVIHVIDTVLVPQS
ncbi:MAG: fasciclin domain-containing protein [Granulosicoccus sp.]|nr:fasciclin domain-containing protein [Granulosicoccus sp.]